MNYGYEKIVNIKDRFELQFVRVSFFVELIVRGAVQKKITYSGQTLIRFQAASHQSRQFQTI